MKLKSVKKKVRYTLGSFQYSNNHILVYEHIRLKIPHLQLNSHIFYIKREVGTFYCPYLPNFVISK